MPKEFYVDSDCIGATWMRSITVQRSDGSLYIFNIRPPPYWREVCFKQLSRKEYHEEQLEWPDEDGGDVEQDEWMDVICDIIDREHDTVYLNNDNKCAIMNMFGFKKCINKKYYNVDVMSKDV